MWRGIEGVADRTVIMIIDSTHYIFDWLKIKISEKTHIEFESKDWIPLPYTAISTIPVTVTIQSFANSNLCVK